MGYRATLVHNALWAGDWMMGWYLVPILGATPPKYDELLASEKPLYCDNRGTGSALNIQRITHEGGHTRVTWASSSKTTIKDVEEYYLEFAEQLAPQDVPCFIYLEANDFPWIHLGYKTARHLAFVSFPSPLSNNGNCDDWSADVVLETFGKLNFTQTQLPDDEFNALILELSNRCEAAIHEEDKL